MEKQKEGNQSREWRSKTVEYAKALLSIGGNSARRELVRTILELDRLLGEAVR